MRQNRKLDHDWFPSPVPENVMIGDRSWIYSAFCFIHSKATGEDAVSIGNDTGIYNGTFFELGPEAEVSIGDFCALVGVIVNTNGHVVIGDHSFFAHEVVLADTPFAFPGGPVSQELFIERTECKVPGIQIGENCWIGMRSVILSGTKLGHSCIVGANAVVDLVAPPYSIIAGNPAKIVGHVTPPKGQ